MQTTPQMTDEQIAEIMAQAFPKTKCTQAYLQFARALLASGEQRIKRLQAALIRESREAFAGNIEAIDKLGLDSMQAQPILLAVQNWDISTGRARELLRCWVLGTFKVDMLPACGDELFGDDTDEPRQVFELLRTWEADAQAKAARLAKHLQDVLEVARAWQPDYAQKMDRDTVRLAEELLAGKQAC